MSAFGDEVKRLRLNKEWSLDQLADEAGITKSYISRIERDEPHAQTGKLPNPSAAAVKKLAVALDWNLTEARAMAGIVADNVIRRVPFLDDLPPDLQNIYALQGRAFKALPPGAARDRYKEKLRASAEADLAMIEERLGNEQ